MGKNLSHSTQPQGSWENERDPANPNGVARAQADGKTRSMHVTHTLLSLTTHTQMFTCAECGRMHARQARDIRAGKTCLDT